MMYAWKNKYPAISRIFFIYVKVMKYVTFFFLLLTKNKIYESKY